MVENRAITEAPLSLTCYSVVSRYSVCLALLIAGINDLDIIACDIGNAYLNAPCQYKVWFAAGMEHGPEKSDLFVFASLRTGQYGQIMMWWSSNLGQVLLQSYNSVT